MTTYRPAVGERCRMRPVETRDYKPVTVTAVTGLSVIVFDGETEKIYRRHHVTFQPLPNLELIVDQIRNAETRAEAIQLARGYFDDTMHFGEVVER